MSAGTSPPELPLPLDQARIEPLQSLWSGYGSIKRHIFDLASCRSGIPDSVIVKHVKVPAKPGHPRGWNTDLSQQRKIRSYEVESAWYRAFARECDRYCRVPECWQLEAGGDEFLMVLEDLDAAGFPCRHERLSPEQMLPCLRWLAHFHATFMGCSPMGDADNRLWPVGTYWHLETRPDELAALDDRALKKAAGLIDQKLSRCQYQTLVHGDAKLANFCFSEDGESVAAVDFQYTGGGCGIKDVAYFIGSCMYERECEQHEVFLLDAYFSELGRALEQRKSTVDVAALEAEWRSLYAFAWADFHRFLKGWSPGHWKINDYSEELCRQVILELGF